MRAQAGRGQGVGPVILLWPASNVWPGPEMDLLELPEADRSRVWSTLHWRGVDGRNAFVASSVPVDATKWHVYAVDWKPDSLTYLIDGVVVAFADHNVPKDPVWVALQEFVATQTDNWYHGAPDDTTPATVRMLVDWVSVTGACLAPR